MAVFSRQKLKVLTDLFLKILEESKLKIIRRHYTTIRTRILCLYDFTKPSLGLSIKTFHKVRALHIDSLQ